MAYKKRDFGQKKDYRQEVTDSIIAALEKGVPPWKKGWQDGTFEMPMNPVTGTRYHGGNAMTLLNTSFERGYADPRWITYRQAQDKDWQVRKGEHGKQIEFWKPVTKEEDGISKIVCDESGRELFIHRVYTVFNACQIDGIPLREKPARNEVDIIQSGENILRNSGANIIHAEMTKAYYRSSTDTIYLPLKSLFKSTADYYGTALHELAHWSGAPHRLNRETLTDAAKFGDELYAREELRAELASVFISAERGIPCDLENNSAYIENWLKALKEDKNEIFRAASDADKAADFILSLEHEKALDNSMEQNEIDSKETSMEMEM